MLSYEYVGWPNGEYFKWRVEVNGYEVTGTAKSIRQVHRRAKKSIKRYNKIKRLLENDK